MKIAIHQYTIIRDIDCEHAAVRYGLKSDLFARHQIGTGKTIGIVEQRGNKAAGRRRIEKVAQIENVPFAAAGFRSVRWCHANGKTAAGPIPGSDKIGRMGNIVRNRNAQGINHKKAPLQIEQRKQRVRLFRNGIHAICIINFQCGLDVGANTLCRKILVIRHHGPENILCGEPVDLRT